MKIERLTPHIGAEISGIDIDSAISGSNAEELRAALYKHQVIFVRDQPLDADRQLALAEVFGEPIPDSHPKFGCVDGKHAVAMVVNDADNPPDINVWHTDLTFRDPPAGTCVLHCVEVPSNGGGNTIWSSMFAAHDALSEETKRYLRPMRAYHQLPLDGRPPELTAKVMGQEISATHPVIRWIPEAGRAALFVNRVYTNRIEGVSPAESHALLHGLFAIAESPDHQVRFRWNAGDTAIWDNRSTQHYAVADYWPERRVMHRVAVRGEAVIALPGQKRRIQ